MLAIFIKELTAYFDSLIAYLFIAIYLAASGLLVWYMPETNILDFGFADLGLFFQQSPYVFLLLIPGITMRLFAEEQKSGTLEWLLTKPLGEWEIVLGKFLAAYALVCVAIVPTTVYVYSVYQLANPVGNLDVYSIVGSYMGLLALAALFTALGVFASILTENQIVAFVIALLLCYFFYDGFLIFSKLIPSYSVAYAMGQLSIGTHYEPLSKGWITLKSVFYFMATTSLVLYSTVFYLNIRKWPTSNDAEKN